MNGHTATQRRRRGRVVLKAALALLGLCLLAAFLAIFASYWLLKNLDHPWVKSRLLSALKAELGVTADFEKANLSLLEGFVLEGLRIESPEPFRAFAPTFLAVKKLEIRWNVDAFLHARVDCTKVLVDGVRINLVQDEAGRSSLQALLEKWAKPKKEEAKSRLSEGLPLRGLPVQVEHLEVRDVVLSRLSTSRGQVVLAESLEGLEVLGALGNGKAWVEAKSGTGEGLRVSRRAIDQEGNGTETAVSLVYRIRAQADDPLHLAVLADIPEVQQTVFDKFHTLRQVLSLDIGVEFQPEASAIAFDVNKLTLLGGTLSATLSAGFFEDPQDQVVMRLRTAQVSADLSLLFSQLAEVLEGVTSTGGFLKAGLEAVEILSVPPYVRVRGKLFGALALDASRLEHEGRAVEARGVEIGFEGAQASETAEVKGRVAFKLFRLKEPGRLVTIRDAAGYFSVSIEDIAKAVAGSMKATAKASLMARMASMRNPSGRIRLASPKVEVATPLALGPWLSVSLGFEEAKWIPSAGRETIVPKTWAEVLVQDLALDKEEIRRSKGTAKISGKVGDEITFESTFRKEADELLINTSVMAKTLAPVAPLAEGVPNLRIALDRMGLRASLRGRVFGLSARPHIEQDLSATFTAVEGTFGKHKFGAESLAAEVGANGHLGDLRLTVRLDGLGLRLNKAGPLRVSAVGEARWNSQAPTMRLNLDVGGKQSKIVGFQAEIGLSERTKGLSWQADASLRNLDNLAPLLPGELAKHIGLGSLAAKLSSKGRLAGVFEKGFRITRDPLRNAQGEIAAHLELTGLGYYGEKVEIDLKQVTANVEASKTGEHWVIAANLSYPSLRFDQRVRRFEVEGVKHSLLVEGEGDPSEGDVKVSLENTVDRLRQDVFEAYQVGQAFLRARLRISALNAVRIDEITFENPLGGTRLEANIAIDELSKGTLSRGRSAWELILGRRSLALSGTLEQRLDALPQEAFRSSGTVKVSFEVQSGDRAHFRVASSVSAHAVDFELPGRLLIKGLSGTVPIEEEVALEAGRPPRIILESDPNLFSRVRFQDQHPFLRTDAYIIFDRAELGPIQIGPVAGNLRVAKNVLNFDQMEASWKEGKVFGQLVLEWRPEDVSVYFRGKMTGIRPKGSEERLDANAAIGLSIGKQAIQGRIHLVRIGRGHLFELLDMWDPYRENVSANRIRKALKLGYPKYVRIRMDGGFLSAKVELGGLGGLVRIDEIRGVPTGPIMSRFLGRKEITQNQVGGNDEESTSTDDFSVPCGVREGADCSGSGQADSL